METFKEFKRKQKFTQDLTIFYPGIAEESMRPILTEKINLAADDFELLAESGAATEKDYLDKMEAGLNRFASDYDNLDTEARERICHYFQELMDIVGLESSGGKLNQFLYGFDPLKLGK